MPMIKRYPNRKLYDTQAKQYITLEEIANLIRQGQEIQVLDHATNEDLTAVTLTLVIFEQEKKRRGFLPQAVLTGLIQSGGETLGSIRRALALPLGLQRQVDEEIERRIRALVAQGELDEREGQCLLEKLAPPAQRPLGRQKPSDSDIERLLAARGVPSQQDFAEIVRRLDELTVKLEQFDLESG